MFQTVTSRPLLAGQVTLSRSFTNTRNHLAKANNRKIIDLTSSSPGTKTSPLVRIDAQNFKTFKPITPGLRHVRRPVQPEWIHKGGPMRHLTVAKRSTGGRNDRGRITMRGRGGGHRRRIRLVDFRRSNPHDHQVIRIEVDPGRSGHIALLRRVDHQERKEDYSYILASEDLRPGDIVKSWTRSLEQKVATDPKTPQLVLPPTDSAALGGSLIKTGKSSVSASTRISTAAAEDQNMPKQLRQALVRSAALKPGNVLPLSAIPQGTHINSISLTPTGKGILCRAAGASATMLKVGSRWAQVRLQSGEIRQINKDCSAVIGGIGNKLHGSINLGKAGRSRWLGRRPKVRGVAMNAVDHPLGGGRGKSKGNKQPRSPTGVLAKGFRTRRPGPRGNMFVIKQRPRGKAKRAA